MIEKIFVREAIVSASGTVYYSDIFGVSHWTRYCTQYIGPSGFSPCDGGGNDVDREDQSGQPNAGMAK